MPLRDSPDPGRTSLRGKDVSRLKATFPEVQEWPTPQMVTS